MSGPTAYGLPVPPLVTFTEAEAIGRELHDRWQTMSGAEPPIDAGDFAYADIVQFVIRRAYAVSQEREHG